MMSQQGAALQSYNNELVKCEYALNYMIETALGTPLGTYDLLAWQQPSQHLKTESETVTVTPTVTDIVI